MKISISKSLVFAIVTTVFAQGVIAQEKAITIKFAHFLPATHSIYVEGAKKFVEEVTSRSNGRVKFEVYPANQLGGDQLAILRSGLADIVMLVPSYAPDKFPLTSVAELPSAYASACEGAEKLMHVGKDGGVLADLEFKPNGFRVLFVDTLPQYKILSTAKEVKVISDMVGLKIRANGVAMDKTIRALGAIPIKVTAGEMYDATTRGTIDAAIYPYNGVKPFKLEQVYRYAVEGIQIGAGNNMVAINNKAWNALPSDIKNIMTEAAASAQKSLCEFQDKEEVMLRDEFIKNSNWRVTSLSKQQAEQWSEKVRSVSTEWASELDRAGKKGTVILKAFQDAGKK